MVDRGSPMTGVGEGTETPSDRKLLFGFYEWQYVLQAAYEYGSIFGLCPLGLQRAARVNKRTKRTEAVVGSFFIF